MTSGDPIVQVEGPGSHSCVGLEWKAENEILASTSWDVIYWKDEQ